MSRKSRDEEFHVNMTGFAQCPHYLNNASASSRPLIVGTILTCPVGKVSARIILMSGSYVSVIHSLNSSLHEKPHTTKL